MAVAPISTTPARTARPTAADATKQAPPRPVIVSPAAPSSASPPQPHQEVQYEGHSFDNPFWTAERIPSRWVVIVRASFTNDGSRDRRAQASHCSRSCSACLARHPVDLPELLLEQVCPVERAVGLLDLGELRLLAVGERRPAKAPRTPSDGAGRR
jgi:hypothetical protein